MDSHAADVQAELQQYLNSKNINSLFIQIVESLLIEKPANPISFMIEYLNKQYPEQAKAALEALAPRFSQAAQSKVFESKADDIEEEEEDEEEDEDYEVKQQSQDRKQSRRVGVSAESSDPATIKAQRSNLVIYEKSPEVTSELLAVVARSPLLKALDNKQKDLIVKAFSGPIEKTPGDKIIVQGDIGDCFYLLEEGTVDVYVKRGDKPNMKVHTYAPGDAFGELALMYNAPRAASCTAASDCRLWALDRVSFKVIVVAAAMEKRAQYQGFLQEVPVLKSLTELEIMTLADSLAEEEFDEGGVICNQGDAGNFFYIVKEGEAVCTQVDAKGKEKEVGWLKPGHYFGEIALITTKPRQATVRAKTDLKVLAIDRATFTRVMGPLDELMKRNFDEYNNYAIHTI